jgi:hypothetical protein
LFVGVEGVLGEERSWCLKEKGVFGEGVDGNCRGGVWRSDDGELVEESGEFSGLKLSAAVAAAR